MLENEHLKKQHAAQLLQLNTRLEKEVETRVLVEEARDKKAVDFETQVKEMTGDKSKIEVQLGLAKGRKLLNLIILMQILCIVSALKADNVCINTTVLYKPLNLKYILIPFQIWLALSNKVEKIFELESELSRRVIDLEEIRINYETHIQQLQKDQQESIENFKNNFVLQSGIDDPETTIMSQSHLSVIIIQYKYIY